MKKKILFVLALSAVMSLASCGAADDGSADSKSAAAVTVTEGGEESAPAEETTTPTETETAETEVSSAAEESSAAETASAAESAAESSADSSASPTGVISTANGDITYDELVINGLANQTKDGVYYALVNDGGGAAGSTYYTVYTSEDGNTWEKSEHYYQEPNGDNTHLPLNDGRMLVFTYDSAYNEPYPYAWILTLNGDAISVEEKQDFFSNVKYDDETPITEGGHMEYYVTYDGGYRITVTMTSENGNTLYKQFDLDPATLNLQV